MNKTIIHVDMDAFFAAVEIRDNPALAGKPLIIGALPSERGVVSTCSYEARTYGVHSAMNIKDAYRLCPHGIYMHPSMGKYHAASVIIQKIWTSYTDIVECISLDEGYLDVTGSLQIFGGAEKIGREIKEKTLQLTGLTCSVGIGYSMASAKLASEEKKPDGLFAIPNREALLALIDNRDVRTIYGIGKKTAERLHHAGIYTVRDIRQGKDKITILLGRHGQQIVALADGMDTRKVTPYDAADVQSVGREHTFQQDITDRVYLNSVLCVIAKELSMKLRLSDTYIQTVTLKVTFGNMTMITRSKSGNPTHDMDTIYQTATALLNKVEKKPIRLIGISVSGFTTEPCHQLTLDNMQNMNKENKKKGLDAGMLKLQRKYGADILKTGIELEAEQYLSNEKEHTHSDE